MKFLKQSQALNLDKVYCDVNNNTKKRHGTLLPNTIRCIVCGPSNCGKTNLVIGLLLHKNGPRFKNVYVYSKTLFQPKYLFLEEVLRNVPNVVFSKYHANEDVLSPQDAQSDSIIIFDDVASEKQNNIRNYFTMGRHKKIDCFYLHQTYSKIPKQLIRDNSNLLVLFKQDELNLRHIYDDHVNTDMTWSEFKDLCREIWSEPYSYVVINKDCEKNKGCYRKRFDTFVVFN